MKTKMLYLEDPYLKTVDATVVEVTPHEDGTYRIVLDQTVFYPRGGGQPSDHGLLTFEDGSRGEIYQVRIEDGEIYHYVKTNYAPQPHQKVVGDIDWERRYRNMKVHSGGHVIDFALFQLGYSPEVLSPLKGDHGRKPFIVYQGSIEEDIRLAVEAKSNLLVEEGRQFSWSFESLEDLEKEAIYLQPGLPSNKPLRALRLEGVGAVADGGTIVASTSEVGKITIISIKSKNAATKIRYAIA